MQLEQLPCQSCVIPIFPGKSFEMGGKLKKKKVTEQKHRNSISNISRQISPVKLSSLVSFRPLWLSRMLLIVGSSRELIFSAITLEGFARSLCVTCQRPCHLVLSLSPWSCFLYRPSVPVTAISANILRNRSFCYFSQET